MGLSVSDKNTTDLTDLYINPDDMRSIKYVCVLVCRKGATNWQVEDRRLQCGLGSYLPFSWWSPMLARNKKCHTACWGFRRSLCNEQLAQSKVVRLLRCLHHSQRPCFSRNRPNDTHVPVWPAQNRLLPKEKKKQMAVRCLSSVWSNLTKHWSSQPGSASHRRRTVWASWQCRTDVLRRQHLDPLQPPSHFEGYLQRHFRHDDSGNHCTCIWC